MGIYRYYAPKFTMFGYNCVSELGSEIAARGLKKALLVTDKTLVKMGLVAQITDVLDKSGIAYALFDEVKPNPTDRNVNDCVARQKQNVCDFLLSIGGGSAHDCAKAAAVLSTNGGVVSDYKGMDKSRVMPLPLVAINTTAGTASECTCAYVIVEEATNIKAGNRDKDVLPIISVDDHSLMMGLPKGLTAGTGMDALTHAVEAYTSVRSFCLTSSLGLAAIRLVFQNLAGAALNPNGDNREGMATGQYLAGLSFGNAGCGLVHSMSHQLSAVYDLPHGLCNAILLPSVMRFNCHSAVAQDKYAELADMMFPFEGQGLSSAQRAALFITKAEELSETVGTRVSLSSLGVMGADLPLLSDKALLDGSLGNNPIIPTKDEIIAIYRALL